MQPHENNLNKHGWIVSAKYQYEDIREVLKHLYLLIQENK